MNRKAVVLVLTAMLCMLTATVCFAAPLWESDVSETVTSGVQLRKLDRFYKNTWDQVRVLYVDLDNPYVSLRILTSKNGTSTRETTLSMAQNSGAVAAVNGDFFNMLSGPTNMLGMVVQNGEMTSTPSKDTGLANFALLEDNSVVMDYFSFSGKVTSPQGYSSELYAINKVPVTTGGVTMLSSAWGKQTMGNIDGVTMTELVVENDVVTQIRIGQGMQPIPENGYVLVTNGAINGFLKDNFQIGDRVQIDAVLSPNTTAIREATGGGTVLVKNGKVAKFTNNVAGYAQRTAVGIDKSGKTLMLVTVDGRLAECEGMNQTELANLLIELGCETALNLDGGGSTTMVARERFSGDLQVQNTLTGSMRAVSTSIGVFESAPDGAPYGIIAQPSAEAVAVGSPVQVYYAVHDAYYNNIYVPAEAVQIITDRPAYIEGNTIYPSEGGIYNVTVAYGGVQQTVAFTSVAAYADISVYPQSAQIEPGAHYSFLLVGTDALGNTVNIPAALAQWQVEGNAFSVEGGNVRALSEGNANVRVDFGGLIAYASVSTPGAVVYNKPVDVNLQHIDYGEGNGYEICVTGSLQSGGTLLEHLLELQRTEILGTSDVSYRLGDYAGNVTGVDKINGFSKKSINNNLLITVSNAKGSIRQTDQTQWAKLISAVQSASEQSIILMMQNPVSDLEAGEQRVLEDILSKAAAAGKKVYLVYEGSETSYTVNKGVTHLMVGAMQNARTKTFFTDRQRFACLKLTLTLNGVRFTYVE